MIISIIQPSFLPWLGYFEQMAVANLFVYLDDVQYTRKDWRNRNRLKSPSGIKWGSVPVHKGAGRGMLIKDACINYNNAWQENVIAKIVQWYRKATYFDDVFPLFRDVLENRYDFLVDLNYALDRKIMGYLEISTPLYKSSDIAKKSRDQNMEIIEICSYHGADILYDGKSAQQFIDKEMFRRSGISVIFQDYKHKPYPQLWGDFVSHLSVLDLLMNCGLQSREILLSSPMPKELQVIEDKR